MKKASLAFLLCILAVSAGFVRAQDKPKSETDDKKVERKILDTAIRVQVVFNDYDGDKKIASLPYTLLIDAGSARQSSIRMGLRVPIPSGPVSDNSMIARQFTYQNIGADIDGIADCLDDGRYRLHLNLDRSSVYTANNSNLPKAADPVIQTFRTSVDLLMRDGQTIQSIVATDPVSGHVTKVDVTLTVVK
jgi:hypothetical protein